jgi:periplasmic protein TonB
MKPIEQDSEGGIIRRHRLKVIAAAVVVVGVVAAVMFGGKGSVPKRKVTSIQMVAIALPPPPPPPPPPRREPPPSNQREETMIAQETVTETETKPEAAPAPSEPSMGTGIKGDGAADGFGLSSTGSGNFIGGSSGRAGGGGGSRWGWYAGQVQSSLQTALSGDPRTRSVALNVTVRIWADALGRIERVEVQGVTGDAAITAAVKDVLTGLRLREAAPDGMPMPIVLLIKARRPS